MSIKNKRQKTTNKYRLKKIEEYLISQGYVRVIEKDKDETRHRWVDCVNSGRDISYDAHEVLADLRGYPAPDTDSKDGYFKIDNPRKHEIYNDAYSVKEAVKRSRHQANWDETIRYTHLDDLITDNIIKR